MTARQSAPGYDGNNVDPTSAALGRAYNRIRRAEEELSVAHTRIAELEREVTASQAAGRLLLQQRDAEQAVVAELQAVIAAAKARASETLRQFELDPGTLHGYDHGAAMEAQATLDLLAAAQSGVLDAALADAKAEQQEADSRIAWNAANGDPGDWNNGWDDAAKWIGAELARQAGAYRKGQ